MPLVYAPDFAYGDLFYGPDLATVEPVYSQDIGFVPPSPSNYAGSVVTSDGPISPTVGEAILRAAVKQLMIDTNLFDDVWIGGKIDWGKRPSVAAGGSVQAISTKIVQGYDSGETALSIYETQMRLGLYVKNENSETRDAIAQRLLQTVSAALYHVSIAGFTVPDTTAVVSWTWNEAKDVSPPTREVEAMLHCDWLSQPGT